MRTSHVEAALEEMDHKIAESQFQNNDGMPVSIPCGLSFNEYATLDTDALESELEKRDIGVHIAQAEYKEDSDRWYLNAELYGRDYKRIRVKAWPDSVRIYPREDQPELTELAQITRAIEVAFDAGLEHDPIE